jgi:hypothetical protein
MGKKIQNMAVFIEFLAGSGLAIFFHLVLNYQEAAYITFGFGVLLSLATYLLREDIERTREGLIEKYNQAHEITFAIAHINDPECQARAHELMAGAKRSLQLLQQGYIPLDETEFYLEGAKGSDHAERYIKAVDPVNGSWNTRAALFNFYQANLRALERGVKITRIFVIDPEGLSDPETQKILLTQLRDKVEVRIAYRNELPTTSNAGDRETNCSFDFTIYDDRVVTDVFFPPNKYFGKKTREPSEVSKYLHLFDLIGHTAHAVTVEYDKIILAVNAIAAGS